MYEDGKAESIGPVLNLPESSRTCPSHGAPLARLRFISARMEKPLPSGSPGWQRWCCGDRMTRSGSARFGPYLPHSPRSFHTLPLKSGPVVSGLPGSLLVHQRAS